MRSTLRLRIGTVLLAALAVAACESNPPLGPAGDGDFDVQVNWSPDHVHTLGDGVTFTVEITDHDGTPVTDFEAVTLERRLEGKDTWREIELELAGDVYQGTYVFTTSGQYQLRVMAQEHGADGMEVLHEVHDPMHVARAHTEAGGYRIEFETFPGHIHEGDEADVTFWVMEAEEDADGHRHAIEGLSPELAIEESDGTTSTYDAHEHEAGEYGAHHRFGAAGECHLTLRFTGADGTEAEAEFHIHVSHAH